jgi:hypothetical protein
MALALLSNWCLLLKTTRLRTCLGIRATLCCGLRDALCSKCCAHALPLGGASSAMCMCNDRVIVVWSPDWPTLG